MMDTNSKTKKENVPTPAELTRREVMRPITFTASDFKLKESGDQAEIPEFADTEIP